MKLSAFFLILALAAPAFASDDVNVDPDALEKARRMQQREQLRNNFNKVHPNVGKTIPGKPATLQEQQRQELQQELQKRRQDLLGQKPQ